MKKKKILSLLMLILSAAIIYVIATAVTIWNYQSVDERQAADVAIVLGAATWGDEVSPVFRERINHGIWLYEQNYVKKIILTGGKTEGSVHSEAYIAMQYALQNGVPEEAILLEEESTVTLENLENAKAIMEAKGYDNAIIVSDPLHMKRVRLLARECEMTAWLSPTPTTMFRSLSSKLPFLAREVFMYTGYQLYCLLR